MYTRGLNCAIYVLAYTNKTIVGGIDIGVTVVAVAAGRMGCGRGEAMTGVTAGVVIGLIPDRHLVAAAG